MRFNYKFHALVIALILSGISACRYKQDHQTQVYFETLDSSFTGIHFSNDLAPSPEVNMFEYMYFYNGAGVGLGDFNRDGRIDIFFASSLHQNKLYLNDGNLKFRDVTGAAGIPDDGGWSTGVSVIDINQDGWLDIYVCRVGNLAHHKSHNLLLVCRGLDQDGVPVFSEESAKYGIDFSGFSTQATFLDYDLDGDLDMYLLNHSLRFKSTFSDRSVYAGTRDSASGDRLYRNIGNRFEDVTGEAGINSTIIGYGLGIAASDMNLDGYPDLYIANDFQENDYLYLNQHNGTFRDELTQCMMHTSQFSMGVDVGDVNNDCWPDVISLDMLPEDPYILKRSLGEDEITVYNIKRRLGFNPQYTRNNLQFNRRNGMFSEIGQYAGVAATDWSWAPLWMDFDNDGLKDLFISNGIPKRLNDIDYISFVSNEDIQQKIRTGTLEKNDFSILDKIPEIKLPNKFYHNRRDFQFEDLGSQEGIKNNLPTYSNGAAYADLDNDGDLDIVVNNINDPALIYRNTLKDSLRRSYLGIRLMGAEKNRQAIGAKIFVYTNEGIGYYEKTPTHGFQSSMEVPVHIGLVSKKIDSILLVWPDNTFQKLSPVLRDTLIEVVYQKGLPVFNYQNIESYGTGHSRVFENISGKVDLLYRHRENQFNEFDREPLIPHLLSREGPPLAVGDFSGDSLEDVFIGSSKREKPSLFIQSANGTFRISSQPALDADSVFEDTDACWMDANNDGHKDLLVASGGNEFDLQSEFMAPRLYLNDGKGHLQKNMNAFKNVRINASCVVPLDFNEDGRMDVFIGGRSIPFSYGEIPHSFLLENDGHGNFSDVTSRFSDGLLTAGFITGAVWTDLDGDKKNELVLSQEWGGIDCYRNSGGKFIREVICRQSGWWNFILPCDVDLDGDLDLVAGNLGLNNRFKASPEQPVRMYVNDFDDNGKQEQILTFYQQDIEIPFATKMELERQLPSLKKRFLKANDYAKASLAEMFSSKKLNSARVFSANYFSNAVLINNGNLKFSVKPLPWQAQLTCYRDAVVLDANQDSLPDLLLAGNNYGNTVRLGRDDADFGTLLVNRGNGSFECETLRGLTLKGEIRHIQPIMLNGRQSWMLVRNNDSAAVIRFRGN